MRALILVTMILATQLGHATPQQEAVINCTNSWLVNSKGVPADRLYDYYQRPIMNLGGPSLMHYVHYVSGCLAANHWRVGDTSQIGNPQEATPLGVAVGQFSLIIRR